MTRCRIQIPGKKYILCQENGQSFLKAVIQFMWNTYGRDQKHLCADCVFLKRKKPETVCICTKYPYTVGNTWHGHWAACGLFILAKLAKREVIHAELN
jgi:hypothetical protein